MEELDKIKGIEQALDKLEEAQESLYAISNDETKAWDLLVNRALESMQTPHAQLTRALGYAREDK